MSSTFTQVEFQVPYLHIGRVIILDFTQEEFYVLYFHTGRVLRPILAHRESPTSFTCIQRRFYVLYLHTSRVLRFRLKQIELYVLYLHTIRILHPLLAHRLSFTSFIAHSSNSAPSCTLVKLSMCS
jgi:hypothetical protein